VCIIRLLYNTYRTQQHYCTFSTCHKSWCSPVTVGVGNSSDRTQHTRLIIAECLVRQTQKVIEGSSSVGGQINVHGLICNTVEFSRHSIRSLEAITDNIGTDVKRGCGNLYRLGLEPQVLDNCTAQWHQEIVFLAVGCSLFFTRLAWELPVVPTATYPIRSVPPTVWALSCI
jgi:hypothetical protein